MKIEWLKIDNLYKKLIMLKKQKIELCKIIQNKYKSTQLLKNQKKK